MLAFVVSPDWQAAAEAYPVNQRWIWLNNCGTTPPGRHVVRRMQDYFQKCCEMGPGGEDYVPARLGKKLKVSLARLLNARPEEIALVHNTAEAMTMVSLGLELGPGDEIVLLEDEYPSNVYPWESWQTHGVVLRRVALAATPDEFLQNFCRTLGPRTRVAALSMVHWCTGLPLPLPELAEVCHERSILLVIDGSQGVGQVPLDLDALRPCVVAFSAWKWLLGPLGLGVLVVSEDVLPTLRPVFKGPDSMADPLSYLPYQSTFKPNADRYTYSTANYNDWVYFAESLDWLEGFGFASVCARIHELAAELWRGLEALGFRSAYARDSAPNSGILAVERPGVDCRELARRLAVRGIVGRERLGRLRLAPHVYLGPGQLDQTVRTIAELTG
jgi:cysteine desulfurase / selenocysteine lyase